MVNSDEQKPFHEYMVYAINEIPLPDTISVTELSCVESTMIVLGKVILGTEISEDHQRVVVHETFMAKAKAVPFLLDNVPLLRVFIEKMDKFNKNIEQKTTV